MDSLFHELLAIIYEYLILPKDSFRFSLASKSIYAALPEHLRLLHQWRSRANEFILHINKYKHMVYDIYLCESKCYMSIRKCSYTNTTNTTTIYQLDPSTNEYEELYVYTYIG